MKMAGFTLFELLVASCMLGVLLLMCSASWRPSLQYRSQVRVLQKLQSLLHYAQHMAQARRQLVTVCGSTNLSVCDGAWQDNILVFLNNLRAGQLMRIWHLPKLQLALSWRASLSQNNTINFAADGRTDGERGRFFFKSGAQATAMPAALVLLPSGYTHFAT